MNQLPGHLFAQSPWKSACLDTTKLIEPSCMIPSAVSIAAVALQTKFALSSKILRILGSMPKITCFVDLEKAYNWVPREKLWGLLWEYGVDGCLFLALK